MSQTEETLKVLSVHVDKTAVVALQTGPTLNTRHPVVGVWTNILDSDAHLVTSRDLPQGVPAYQIYDVQLVTDDERQTAVRLLFRRPGSELVELIPVVDDHNYVFEMVVPIQDLAVVQALRMSPESCFFALFDARHTDPSVEYKVTMRDVLIALALPPVESIESDEITEKMTQIISQSFATPFSPISDEDEDGEEDDVPLSVRKAQAFLMTTLVGIALGDEISLRRLVRMEEWYEQYYERISGQSEDTSTDDADQVAFIAAVVHLLRIVMLRSGSAPAVIEETDNPDISPLGSAEHDDEFVNIMKSLEIESDLRRIGSESRQEGTELIRFHSQAATIYKPFADGWPDSMKALENHSVLEGRPALWEIDFTEETPENSQVDDSQFPQVMTAFALVIAARAARAAQMTGLLSDDEDESLQPAIPLVRWLTADEDVYMWELVSLASLVEDYETLQFADLLKHPLYFNLTTHMLAHQLLEEGWTSQSFTEALSKLDVQLPDAKQVAVHLLDNLAQYEAEESDEDEDEPCSPAKALHSLVHSGLSRDQLASAIARLLPTMADLQADQNDLVVGDEQWKEFRKRYIKDLLGSTAATTSRNFVG